MSDRVLPLREAADLIGTTHTALRKRADRGQFRTVMRDGRRCVPLTELERAGLLPDAELQRLRARVAELEGEVGRHRLLAERAESLTVAARRDADAERQARELAEAAAAEHRARAVELAALEEEITRLAGRPFRLWRFARARRDDPVRATA